MDVKSYLSSKTRVKKSIVDRYGLFAVESIKKDEIVAIKGGQIIDWEIFQKKEKLIGDSYLQIDDNFLLAPLKKSEVKKVMLFLNHSCDPNVGLRGEITFVAMRKIKPGEELTIDYAMIDNDMYKMKCNCGFKNCRQTITGKDWKNDKLRQRYKNYFSRYIQDKID